MTASANKPPGLKKKALSPKQRQLHNFSLGEQGENQAVDYLISHGYQVWDTNVAHDQKEIDIVAYDSEYEELVFVEVKTREKNLRGHPSSAVDRDKLRSIQYVAAIYRRKKHYRGNYRFDIITLVSGRIQHYQNVTWGR